MTTFPCQDMSSADDSCGPDSAVGSRMSPMGGDHIRLPSATRRTRVRNRQGNVGLLALPLESTWSPGPVGVRSTSYLTPTVSEHSTFVRPLVEPVRSTSLPVGVELRRIQPEQHYNLLLKMLNETCIDYFGGYPLSPEEFQALMLERSPACPPVWQVAMWNADIAGVAVSSINSSENDRFARRRGWVELVCVRPHWKGRGLGCLLLAYSLRSLQKQGMREAAIACNAADLTHSVRLYRRMGFALDGDGSSERRSAVPAVPVS